MIINFFEVADSVHKTNVCHIQKQESHLWRPFHTTIFIKQCQNESGIVDIAYHTQC